MIKANFMTLADVDVPDPGHPGHPPKTRIDLERLGGWLETTRVSEHNLRFEFSNVQTEPLPISAPFRAHFMVAAEFDTIDNRAVFKGKPQTSLVGGAFELRVAGDNNLTIDNLLMTVFRNGGDSHFRPTWERGQVLQSIISYFPIERIVEARFGWEMVGSDDVGPDTTSDLFRLAFPKNKDTLWEWQRWTTEDPDKDLATPNFGDTRSEAKLVDYVKDENEDGALRQDLQLRRFGCNPTADETKRALALCFKPRRMDRTLDLDPAVRDADQKSGPKNCITYGMTAANGELVVTGPPSRFEDSAVDPFDLHWERALDNPDKTQPVFLINAVTDEHGMPVAFHADGNVPLTSRPDRDLYGSNYQDHLTLGGLDLHVQAAGGNSTPDDPRRKQGKPIRGTINAVKLDTAVRPGGDAVNVGWSRNGEQIRLKEQVPEEVDGGARNAYFSPMDADTRSKASIELEEIQYENPNNTEPSTGPLALKRLRVEEQAQSPWSLTQVYEEFEYGQGALPGINDGAIPVGKRTSEADPAPAEGFALPAMDTRTAASNMAKTTGGRGRVRRSVFTEAATVKWYKEIDVGLIERFKRLEDGKSQMHRQGFGLGEQKAIPYATILGRMRKQIDDLDGAANQPVQAETATNRFIFGKSVPEQVKRLGPAAASAEARGPLQAKRAIMHRVWLLQFIVDGHFRSADDFKGSPAEWGTYGTWTNAAEAIKAIENADIPDSLKPGKIRANLLDKFEGLSVPTRHFKQLPVVLANIVEKERMDLFAELSAEIENRKITLNAITDFEAFKNMVTGSEANQKLVELTQYVQAVINGWGPDFKPERYEITDIGAVLPVYHRLVMAVLRFVETKQHQAGQVKTALERLPAALAHDKKNLFSVFERAWLHKMTALEGAADPKRFFELLGNGVEDTGKDFMDAFKKALLATIAPTQEFATRLLAELAANKNTVDETFNAELKNYQTVIQYFEKLDDILEETRLPDFDAVVEQGRDTALQTLQTVWDKASESVGDDASERAITEAQKYITDEIYSDEVYQKLLDLEHWIHEVTEDLAFARQEARKLRDEIAALINLGENAGDLLQSLKTEPPQYLVVGQAFYVQYSESQQAMIDTLLAMWGRSFDLCSLGAKDVWHFQLTDKTTLIMKLSGALTIAHILKEVQTNFRDDSGEPDPLGLWTEEMRAFGIKPPHEVEPAQIDDWSHRLVSTWVAEFVDPELHIASWRGAFLVNPTADLAGDQMTKGLCGLRYIEMRYLALGGGAIEFIFPPDKDGDQVERRTTLDVYATIFRKTLKQDRENIEVPSQRQKDSGIALIKFDARIKGTQLRGNSSIELSLDINRLFGRDYSQLESDDDQKKYNNLIIRGEMKEPEGGKGKKTLEFAAIFPDPLLLPVDVLFIKAVKLRSIRAALYNGRTALDIDGDIELQKFPVPQLGFDLGAIEEQKLLLSGFRLNFPEIGLSTDAAMGVLRDLVFDFESLKISFETPRSVTLGFMELGISGLGYLRLLPGGDRTRIEALWNQFNTLGGSAAPELDKDLLYMLFDLDFGQLPKFGVGSVDRLQLQVFVGAQIDDNKVQKSYFGISGLDAKDIEIDLFRLLKLSIATLYMTGDVESKLSGYTDKRYSVIGAEDIRLQMLGIDLIGEAKGAGSDGDRGLDYLMLQDRDGGRGVLGMVNMEGSALSPPFIDLKWLLLARNMEVDSQILEHLLLFEEVENHGVVSQIVSREPSGEKPGRVKHVKAGITGKNDWLFGISFGFASFLDNCRLVLQDEVFYGITLQGEFLEPILGEDRMTLAYIPGDTPAQDRFLLDIPLEFLNIFSEVKAGWGTFSWALNTDTLISLGFPFRIGNRYLWDRSFQVYITPYMGQFGFYVEKRTRTLPQQGDQRITIGGGLGVTVGYGFALGNSMLWVRGGIGIFAIIEGSITTYANFKKLDVAIVGMRIRGVVGVIAFVEGGIEIWIVSARFRVELQAALGIEIFFERDIAPLTLAYDATLYASYHASATIKIGFCKITHTVSGSYAIGVSGQHLLE